ncbi:MAG TPA: DUF3037 domain-containing protein [Thermomicrobiales bacterium]|nr:DUF3037 domain-containing protein [Thermomicrobiales bacterium]
MRESFEYALIRVVPRVERGECLNAGVILFSRPKRFLEARVALNEARLMALAPDLTPDQIRGIDRQLQMIPRLCAGDPAAGPIALLAQAERWHWLVAPSSTVIQPSAIHTGMSDNPAHELDRLFASMVNLPEVKLPG